MSFKRHAAKAGVPSWNLTVFVTHGLPDSCVLDKPRLRLKPQDLTKDDGIDTRP